jgi:hypothetical protein
MCVIDFDECTCDCHGDMEVAHMVPCCAGRCPMCCRYILEWAWERHKESHRLPPPPPVVS